MESSEEPSIRHCLSRNISHNMEHSLEPNSMCATCSLAKCPTHFALQKILVAVGYMCSSFIHQWLSSPLLGHDRFFSFVILYTVGRTTLTVDQPVARPLPAHKTAQTQNKRTQTSMLRVGFEPTTPAFQRAKTVHALDGAATVIGYMNSEGR
jgi:hypothetical protein